MPINITIETEKMIIKLKQYSDTEFQALCLSHFSEMALGAGKEQRLDARINDLIEYCLRTQERYDRLVEILFPGHATQLYQNITPAYLWASPRHFDLDELVQKCVDTYLSRQQQGLISFALHGQPEDVVRCLQDRIVELLEDDLLIEYQVSTLSFKYNKVLDFVEKLKRTLKSSNIIQSFVVADESAFQSLWGLLSKEFNGESHVIIVIMNLYSDFELPETIIQLDPPVFSKYHMLAWMQRVNRTLQLPKHVIDCWKQLIWEECSCRSESALQHILDVEQVYSHLKFVEQELQRGISSELFFARLEERRQRYASS